MAFERSRGKPRPTLPRGSDARPGDPAVKPTDERAAHGHFAAGNRTGAGARFTATIKKSLGVDEGGKETQIVARDARRVMLHVLRSFPSEAAPVRVLVAIHARHVALHGYFTARAEAAGLDTPEGLKLLEVADRQSQRAERTLVTAQDMARVCAAQEVAAARPVDAHAALVQALSAEGT